MLQVAYLSGLISVLYYTFVAKREDNKFLKPFSRDENEFDFRRLFVLKSTFDERWQNILEELESVEEIESQELFSRLKNKHYERFHDLNLVSFKRNYLNVMLGVGRKDKEDKNYISKDGKEILKLLRSPIIRSLIKHHELSYNKIEELTKDLKLEKLRNL